MTVAVILLCILLMYFSAYTAAVRRTIRALGLFDREESDRSHMQRVILLGTCLTKLNAAFLLGLAVYLTTSRASTWYYGMAIIVLCWVGSLLIGSASHLRPGSALMVAMLVAELERRRGWYRGARDAARLQAVEALITRIRSMPNTQVGCGSSR